MNLLLLDRIEISETGLVRVSDERAEHMLGTKKLGVADVIEVGEIDGRMGSAEVLEIQSGEIVLQTSFLEKTTPVPKVSLIVALPRPQILKRVLLNAGMLGVHRLMFIRSNRVEKSYFQSPQLEMDNIRKQLILGLEQSKTTYLPRVSIHKRFRPFVEDELGSLLEDMDLALLAHTGASKHLAQEASSLMLQAETKVLAAVGPEGGWQEHEINAFSEKGFRLVSMGDRWLRVDTAVCSLLSQLEVLRQYQRYAGKR